MMKICPLFEIKNVIKILVTIPSIKICTGGKINKTKNEIRRHKVYKNIHFKVCRGRICL